MSWAFPAVTSLMTLSSPVGMWSIFNQVQLYMLLPMIPQYFPDKVGKFILNMDFTLLSFEFLQIGKHATKQADFGNQNTYFRQIGISSGGSMINFLPLLTVIILVVFFHLIVTVNYCSVYDEEKDRKCRKTMNKLFSFFTFSAYIRLFML